MILNKDNKGAEEAKGLMGFIYKANNFENMVTFISISERDVKRVIGPEVYKLAEDHYLSDNYKVILDENEAADPEHLLLDELVKYVQLPVILHAYRRYAPLNDLSHSESGRQITVTDELKPAFEWMIERDNRNLLDLAHEATDMLIEFLDEQQPIPYVPTKLEPTGDPTNKIIEETWRTSATYEAQRDLFINTAREFDSIFPINASRRLYLALVPFIREVEQRHIRPVIGATRYDAIRELIKDGDLDAAGNEESAEIHQLARLPIVMLTMSVALKRLNVELLPDSVVQSFSTISERQTKSADKFDRIGVSMLLERDGRREIIPIQNYITSLLPVVDVIEEETDTEQSFFIS